VSVLAIRLPLDQCFIRVGLEFGVVWTGGSSEGGVMRRCSGRLELRASWHFVELLLFCFSAFHCQVAGICNHSLIAVPSIMDFISVILLKCCIRGEDRDCPLSKDCGSTRTDCPLHCVLML
jgi:hypothetical protein